MKVIYELNIIEQIDNIIDTTGKPILFIELTPNEFFYFQCLSNLGMPKLVSDKNNMIYLGYVYRNIIITKEKDI